MSNVRPDRRDFLVELGTEELPPKALRTLELAFTDGVRSALTQAGLASKSIESFATPRRLAILVRRLESRAPDQLIKRRGPPVAASLDPAGVPTRAGAKFAESCGVAFETLGRERDPKGVEYLSYEGVKSGADTVTLLPAMVQSSLDALPIPKRMRWGALESQFVRPVHWLVMLYGSEVVPASVLGVPAGQVSLGHRFMSDKPLRIGSPSSYVKTLETRGRVIAAFEQRREQIRSQVEATATSLGGRAIIDPALLDEVTALVEWPVPIAGKFEPRFLDLPREVLISTLQEHQRYFPLEDAQGALLPWFITVSNVESPEPDVIRAGNERVVRPRLSDAAFFWQQDRREPLAARLPGLDTVTYQTQLGSLGARAGRLGALAQALSTRIGANTQLATRAAQLAKCDLLTAMVGEFPELQGTMGRYYALADGEDSVVAEAVREHYLPRGAGDALPASRVGDAVALADKLDALAGIFAIGQKPTGTKDPFGLRRAAIGALRIVLEHQLEFDIRELIETAVKAQPLADIATRAEKVSGEIYDYLIERLRAQYLERSADNGVSTEMFDAVLATRPASLLDFDARLRALVGFIARPESASLAAANKRIANILKKSEAGDAPIDAALLRHDAEKALAGAMAALQGSVRTAINARDYGGALAALATLRPAVDAFFDQVLVNDPDSALRNNRLALLRQLRALFTDIADLSCLPG